MTISKTFIVSFFDRREPFLDVHHRCD
jgi:hypothetical protein